MNTKQPNFGIQVVKNSSKLEPDQYMQVRMNSWCRDSENIHKMIWGLKTQGSILTTIFHHHQL